ncbi:sigma-70 family RNA polymerase sigma factor [Shewanella sp. JM162201]|uniref:Sigma-70 family RNA polymerase sigma factor n=1 Tax=Shewanella jiangmenensis TaxID=2837387 RepID=A0ABS5V5W9_9GAMM|nr:sigma-70 family RNA polymerase sigma factor [Shewanella jiangmenensis]MBT1445844.1 sigma-70 family RNA polymerase sigma factor [Shewanella jiangmenensis]
MVKQVQEIDDNSLKQWLLAVANQRDKQAFRALFDYFGPKIRAFGLSRLSQQGLAMDLVQETLTTVWTKAHLFDSDKGNVATWVYTIMRNQCFDMLRRVQHNREDTFGDDIWPLFDSDPASDEFADHKLDNLLAAYLGKLPKLQREVVQGIYLQELSQQELAEKLGVPLGTIKSRLRLGLEKLKSLLEKHHD